MVNVKKRAWTHRDAVYDIVLAVTFAAAVGTLAYHLIF